MSGVHARARGKAEELVVQVQAAGGCLLIDRSDRRNIPSLVGIANRKDKVPAGLRLTHGYSGGGLEVRLEPLPDWLTADLLEISVPATLRRPHAVIKTLAGRDSALDIRGPARTRALRVLNALVSAAAARGHAISDNHPVDSRGFRAQRGGRKGLLTITVRGHEVGVRIAQDTDRVLLEPSAAELRQAERNSS